MKPIPRLEKKENKNLFCYFCKKFIETDTTEHTLASIMRFRACRCLERRNQPKENKLIKNGSLNYVRSK